MKKTAAALLVILTLLLSLSACKKEKKIIFALPQNESSYEAACRFLKAKGLAEVSEKGEITEKPPHIDYFRLTSDKLTDTESYDFCITDFDNGAYGGFAENCLMRLPKEDFVKNSLAVDEGKETTDLTKALAAAMQSKAVSAFIKEGCGEKGESLIKNPGDGLAKDVDYAALKGRKVLIVCGKGRYKDILLKAGEILAEKEITLDIREVSAFNTAGIISEDEKIDAYYFPSENFEGKKAFVQVADIHKSFYGLFAGRSSDLNLLTE